MMMDNTRIIIDYTSIAGIDWCRGSVCCGDAGNLCGICHDVSLMASSFRIAGSSERCDALQPFLVGPIDHFFDCHKGTLQKV